VVVGVGVGVGLQLPSVSKHPAIGHTCVPLKLVILKLNDAGGGGGGVVVHRGVIPHVTGHTLLIV
jgi:hypothetical protein